MSDYGLDNAVQQFCHLASGMSGYGRPSELAERRPYAFAGLVALWRGSLPPSAWPAELADRSPPRPDEDMMTRALEAARALAADVITADSGLRLVWDDGPDGGAALRAAVASLQAALAA